MKKPLSLTLRLFLCVAALNIVTMVVVGLLSLRSANINVSEDYDAQLITEASILWEIIEEDAKDGTIDAFKAHTLDVEQTVNFLDREEKDSMLDYAQWRAFSVWKDGKMAMNSDNASVFPQQPLPAGFSTITVGGDVWRAFSLYDKEDNLVVSTFENLNDRNILQRDILLDVIAPLAVMLPLLALLFSVGVGFGLKDLRKVAKRIATRTSSDLSRLESNDLPRELAPLTHSVNQLLATLEASLAHEREFIDHAAHELRTPLSALKLQTQLLAKSLKDPQSNEPLAEVLASVDRTARLVDQMLLLSRVTQQEILLESVNLYDVVQETIGIYAVRVADKNIKLTLQCDKHSEIKSQAELLRTMIGTILDNAVKYTPKNGEITVQIEQDAKQAKIIITDSGEGISEEERVRVFDRFYRIPSTKQPGSGLGLSIARQIAHMLGADITLETPKISKGLRVSIILASS